MGISKNAKRQTLQLQKLVKLFQLNCGSAKVLVLVVENGLQAATVMILSQQCQLTESKLLTQFDTIKIMHNRLHPLRKAKQVVAA